MTSYTTTPESGGYGYNLHLINSGGMPQPMLHFVTEAEARAQAEAWVASDDRKVAMFGKQNVS